ncbi:MAG: four helix bundle protein [Planctomycetes bacterium]|nr:four helix bundle protein [Planctomycetota bacterium]
MTGGTPESDAGAGAPGKVPPPGRTPSGKPYDLRERTFLFARRCLQISRRIPHGPENHVLIEQFVDAGTSVGANVEEADGSNTKKEQRSCLVIARRSACETRCRLKLLTAEIPQVGDLREDADEAGQLVRILSTAPRNWVTNFLGDFGRLLRCARST